MSSLNHRYEIVLYFDCKDGNPNGDPDAGNMPRVDPETLQGMVSDGAQKRRLRDWVYLSKLKDGKPADGYDLFFGHAGLPRRQVLNVQIDEAHAAALTDKERTQVAAAQTKEKENLQDEFAKHHVDAAQRHLLKSRFDVRAFGAVLSTGRNAGQVRGPVQCTFARSVDPILALEASITRKAVTTRKDAEEQMTKDGVITGTMGRKNFIPYGLFRSAWFVSPLLAEQTGFSVEDFKVLCDGLLQMWELDRSAARGFMATRALVVFQHAERLGNARAHDLFDRVTMTRKDLTKPPRDFADYKLEVNRENPPGGVSIFNLCNPEDHEKFFGSLTPTGG